MKEVCHQVKSFITSNKAYTYKHTLKENYFKDFFHDMLEEIEVHEKRENWTLTERKDLPPGANTIMAIWSFKRKWYPDISINKHESRPCDHGGQKTWGQDYWYTYAPLVTWASVHVLLVVEKFTIPISRVWISYCHFHKKIFQSLSTWNFLQD